MQYAWRCGMVVISVALAASQTAAQVSLVKPTQPLAPLGATPAAQIAALQQRVAALEAEVAALTTKTQLVRSDGQNYVLAVPGTLTLQAQSATLQSQNGLQVKGGTVVVQSLGGLQVAGAGAITVRSASTLQLLGSMVQINGGGTPASRVVQGRSGSQIVPSSTVSIGP